MKTIGALSFFLLLVFSFLLICLIAFAPDDFRHRREWRPAALRGKTNAEHVDLGRLLCLWLYRLWLISLFLTIIYFMGGKHAA